MIEPTEDDIGRAVVYTGNRFPGGKLEEGIITSFHDHAVFECWHVYYGDVHVGTIGIRSGVPVDRDQWSWSL